MSQDAQAGSVKLVLTCEDHAHDGCLQPAVRYLIFAKDTLAPNREYPILALCEEHWPLWADEGHKRGYTIWLSDIYGPHPGALTQL
jgi:hypothetical protein